METIKRSVNPAAGLEAAVDFSGTAAFFFFLNSPNTKTLPRHSTASASLVRFPRLLSQIAGDSANGKATLAGLQMELNE